MTLLIAYRSLYIKVMLVSTSAGFTDRQRNDTTVSKRRQYSLFGVIEVTWSAVNLFQLDGIVALVPSHVIYLMSEYFHQVMRILFLPVRRSFSRKGNEIMIKQCLIDVFTTGPSQY